MPFRLVYLCYQQLDNFPLYLLYGTVIDQYNATAVLS